MLFKDIEILEIDPIIISHSELLNNLDKKKGVIKLPICFDNNEIISYINSCEIIMKQDFIQLIDFLLIKERNINREIINKIKLEGNREIALKAVEFNMISIEEYERWFNIITFHTINIEGVVFTLENEYYTNYFIKDTFYYFNNILDTTILLKNGHLDAFNFLVKNKLTHNVPRNILYKINKNNIIEYIEQLRTPNKWYEFIYSTKILKYCTLKQFIELVAIATNLDNNNVDDLDRHIDALLNNALRHCEINFIKWLLKNNKISKLKILKSVEEQYHYPRKNKYHIIFMKFLNEIFSVEKTSMINEYYFDCKYYTSIEELIFLKDYNYDKLSIFKEVVDKDNLDDLIKFYELFNIKSTSSMIHYVCAINNEEIFDYVVNNDQNSIHDDMYPIIISSAYNKYNYIKKLFKLGYPIHYSASLQACKNGHCDVLKTLFELNVKFSKDCLFFASEYNHLTCVNYLNITNLRDSYTTERNWINEFKKNTVQNDSISLFASYAKIGVPYKLKDIEEFEKINELSLPEDFKQFITKYSKNIGWSNTNDKYSRFFNIYDVKIQDLFELCYKIDTTDEKYLYFPTINEYMDINKDEITLKYNYFKVPLNIAIIYFNISTQLDVKNTSEREISDSFLKYFLSGDVDKKLKNIRKICKSKNSDCKFYSNFWHKYDPIKQRPLEYTSKLYKLNSDYTEFIYKSEFAKDSDIESEFYNEPELNDDSFDEILHKSRMLKIANGGCSLKCYLLLDGIYKGKLYLTEQCFKGNNIGGIMLDSFTDFLIMNINTASTS